MLEKLNAPTDNPPQILTSLGTITSGAVVTKTVSNTVVVPHSFVTANDIGCWPTEVKVMVPGLAVAATAGAPPVKAHA